MKNTQRIRILACSRPALWPKLPAPMGTNAPGYWHAAKGTATKIRAVCCLRLRMTRPTSRHTAKTPMRGVCNISSSATCGNHGSVSHKINKPAAGWRRAFVFPDTKTGKGNVFFPSGLKLFENWICGQCVFACSVGRISQCGAWDGRI